MFHTKQPQCHMSISTSQYRAVLRTYHGFVQGRLAPCISLRSQANESNRRRHRHMSRQPRAQNRHCLDVDWYQRRWKKAHVWGRLLTFRPPARPFPPRSTWVACTPPRPPRLPHLFHPPPRYAPVCVYLSKKESHTCISMQHRAHSIPHTAHRTQHTAARSRELYYYAPPRTQHTAHSST